MSIIFGLCCVILVRQNTATASDNEGVLEKIKNGIKYSKNYLDTAKEIADLVAESLGHKLRKPKGDQNNEFHKSSKPLDSGNIASAFFRLLGLDSTRIAAIAVNSAIFLAHMISSLFNINAGRSTGRDTQEPPNMFNLLGFFMNTKNERLHNLVQQAQSPDLPKQLIDHVDVLDSACIRLLLCKISPVISAVQKSLNDQLSNNRRQLTSWLPKRETFEKNSHVCEKRYLDCNIFPEMDDDPKDW
ncbi:uncharacterized protein LOC135161990 [Diachasmimorpha longicaudata]|uniref:uncharacterized protein LOC135161990 n=1 Tax=Diachasmimorpha longicaudata TaxID=58733 RepID=UPI0030B8DF57